MEENELFTGVLGDPREDPRVKDGWKIEEVIAEAAVINWKKKDPRTEVVNFPVWNQHSSSACVAFAKAKQVSARIFYMTGVWIDFSPASIYQLRANKPQGGMNIGDANEIVNTSGTTLEALMKSQDLSEEQINAVRKSKVADLFGKAIAEAVVRYLYVPIDIDKIAQTIEAQKSVSLLIFATYDEYARMVPTVLDPNLTYMNAPIRHEVVGVDYFLDKNGVKRIFVNDSAHFGGLAVREFTQDFLQKRCILADAIDIFTFDPETTLKPTHTFTKVLEFGKSDPDVEALQDILRYEGFFPTSVPSTGYYGGVTATAVLAWQKKHKVAPLAELESLGGRRVGTKTIAKLNSLYSQ